MGRLNDRHDRRLNYWLFISIILAPEELHLFCLDEFILTVKIGILKNQEVIVVVDIYFRALVDRLAVFNVQGVEMEFLF